MSATPRVLLVEDNAMNRDMMTRRLRRAGFDVRVARDGQQALDLMRAEHPAIVLMDMNLPVLDGWNASRQARQDPDISHIPIIALTAHAMESDRQNALQAGCDEFASKPVDFPALLQKIGELTRS